MKVRPLAARPAVKTAGFSLVEVTLALGIVAFALVAIVGLLAGGLQNGSEARAEVDMANLATAIIGERRAAPTATIPDPILPPLDDATKSPVITAGGQPYRDTVYLTEDGEPTTSAAEKFYRLDYALSRNPTERLAEIYLSLVTPWQAEPGELPGAPGGGVVQTRFETRSFVLLQP